MPKALQRAVYRAWDARQEAIGSDAYDAKVMAHESAKDAAIRAAS